DNLAHTPGQRNRDAAASCPNVDHRLIGIHETGQGPDGDVLRFLSETEPPRMWSPDILVSLVGPHPLGLVPLLPHHAIMPRNRRLHDRHALPPLRNGVRGHPTHGRPLLTSAILSSIEGQYTSREPARNHYQGTPGVADTDHVCRRYAG